MIQTQKQFDEIKLSREGLHHQLSEVIDMYLECIEVHGMGPRGAKYTAVLEILEGLDAVRELNMTGELTSYPEGVLEFLSNT